MDLLEREPILMRLNELLLDAAGGGGRIAVVSGEAGAGKTSLVEHFLAAHANDTRSLRGLCDPLSTPRPLGPLLDMARQTSGPLAAAVRDGLGRDALFTAFLDELGRPPSPRIVVIEDIHWADDATLDLLRFVGRRIVPLAVLLIITYREDEIDTDHGLHHLLGQLPASAMRWLPLPPLSPAAVEELARRKGRGAEGLFELTGGNPFFVTEVLTARGERVPVSIRESVLARAARLTPHARELLDILAVVPGGTERSLVDAMLADAPSRIRECAAAGVLAAPPESIGFRHELARLAWEETLEPGSTARLHARVLRALLDQPGERPDLARVVHHASGAGDVDQLLRFAPAAARQAAAVGAHRQAAAHYAVALRHADVLPPVPRAELLEAFSYERHLAGGIEEATRAREGALALRRQLDDRRAEGADLRWLSRLAWFEGRRDAAIAYGEAAIGVLEPLGPMPELAMAYSNLAQLSMLADDGAHALEWGERAIALAQEMGDVETLVHALVNVGSAELFTTKRADGLQRLERSIDLSLRHGFHEHAVRAYGNIAWSDIRRREYAQATSSVERTLRFAVEHEIETWEQFIIGWRARLSLERGDCEDAERDATAVLARYRTTTILTHQPLVVLALLRARRGEAGADALLDEAMRFALPTAEMQRIGPAASARAEHAWLRGELPVARRELESAAAIVRCSDDRWGRAELAWWIARAGGERAMPDDAPEPFRLHAAGDGRGAAAAWERLGMPYHQAIALADGDAPDAWVRSLALLESLGATATVEAVRRDLRDRGVRGIPRGPRQATRRHPAGLTAAQVRVLELLARGLSNAAIARALYLSPRTVDHHVSAILAKLGVGTRAEAIAAAHERRLLVSKPRP